MVRKTCRVSIDGQVFVASRGDVLADAALKNGIDIPRDCRSGRCGVCLVRVLDGLMVGGECGQPGILRACESRIISDVRIKIEALPDVKMMTGRVNAIKRCAQEVVEIKIEPEQPVVYLPGQYLHVHFRGYPMRCYSPTVSMENFAEREFLHLQVRRLRHGQVSAAIGDGIREGHRVKMQGPFGVAFLRPASQNRLVLVADGAGFAPIWSIAVAAIQEWHQRRVVIVVGARSVESLYMINALCALARYPNVTIIPVVEMPQNVTSIVRTGKVAEHIPELSAEDAVHICGSPRLVDAVSQLAAASGASSYGVPFVPQDGAEKASRKA